MACALAQPWQLTSGGGALPMTLLQVCKAAEQPGKGKNGSGGVDRREGLRATTRTIKDRRGPEVALLACTGRHRVE